MTIPQTLSPTSTNSQQALQWWIQRQIDRQHQSAERIRDGLLQDLFAIRRSLENIQDEPPSITTQHLAQVMTQLDTLHVDLEAISNHLSPPFAFDNLNLAVQHLLQQWQQQHPTVSLVCSLTLEDQVESKANIGNHHLILTSLTEWLDIITPLLSDAAELNITLHSEAMVYPPRSMSGAPDMDSPDSNSPNSNSSDSNSPCGDRVILTLGLYEPNLQQRDAIAQHPSLIYLCHAFQLLSSGEVVDNVRQENPGMQWQFCWSVP